MFAARFLVTLSVLSISALPCLAQLRAQKVTLTAATTETSGFLDQVGVAHRDVVSKVIAKPTLSTKTAEDPFTCTTAIYSWMLEHPDRVSLAWQRLDVPCVDITSLPNGQFAWADDQGSKLIWEPVAKLNDGVVWYATGHVKPAALLPMVPVKAVAVLRYPGIATKTPGLATITPELQVWFQTDNRAASAILRMIGPAAPKMAEEGAGQLLYFFSGVGKYVQKHPTAAPALLAGKDK
ncbi:hypothetical protein BH11PLA2_BH11PLA2_34130 [soil metagenome]